VRIEEEIDWQFRSEQHKVMINLIYTAGLFRYRFLQYLKKYDIGPSGYNVLKILKEFGGKARSLDFLRKRMLDKNSDISRIVDNLYKKELIKRDECPVDRRKKDISITQKGIEILNSIEGDGIKIEQFAKNLSLQEAAALNRLLDKIRGNR